MLSKDQKKSLPAPGIIAHNCDSGSRTARFTTARSMNFLQDSAGAPLRPAHFSRLYQVNNHATEDMIAIPSRPIRICTAIPALVSISTK